MRRRMAPCSLLAAAFLSLRGAPAAADPSPQAPAAPAEEPAPGNDTKGKEPARNYVNLRVGGASSGSGAVICAEVAPISFLSVSACGVGSGFLSHSSQPTMVVFQGHARLASWKLSNVWLEPRIQAGFAELQAGEDALGFYFDGTGPTGVETAGPSAGASMRAVMPVWRGVDFLTVASLDAAYFHHAPQMLRPLAQWQPSLSITMGVGF